MKRIRKRKYTSECDNPRIINEFSGSSNRSFEGMPILLSWDYTPNGAPHLRSQGRFNSYDYPDTIDDMYKFLFTVKI